MDGADDRRDNDDVVSRPRVELTADTLEHIRGVGCLLDQDSYVAEPLPQEAVVELLRDGQGMVQEAADGTGR